MLFLSRKNIDTLSFSVPTGWLLASCMEAKGKQDLFVAQRSEVLRALRERAIIQSAESSNRIEGVTVAPERLRPIVLGKSRPRDRSEEEVVGYRRALNWIFARKRPVEISSQLILRLHEFAQGGHSGDAGQWKKRNNEIVEILPNGERVIRFVPVSARKTPKMISRLCECYSDLGEGFPVLLAIGAFVFDFLCIHPFRDGNGRVSRLLTTLLLQQEGFIVGRYISLERIVEETKEDYYRILRACSAGWHDGKNELAPWWNYFLSLLNRAYGELEQRVEDAGGSGKSDIVRRAIERQMGSFSLADLRGVCPSVSPQLIKKILQEKKKAGEIRLEGKGRGARWIPELRD